MRGTPLKKFGPYRVTQPHRKYKVGSIPGYDCWDLWDTRTDTLVGYGFVKDAVYRAGDFLQHGGPALTPQGYRHMTVETYPQWTGSLFEYYQFVFSGVGSYWINGGLLPRILDPLSEEGRKKERDRTDKNHEWMILDGEPIFPTSKSIIDQYLRGDWPVEPVPLRIDVPGDSIRKLHPVGSDSPFGQLMGDPTIPVTLEWLAECLSACAILLEIGTGDKTELTNIQSMLAKRFVGDT